MCRILFRGIQHQMLNARPQYIRREAKIIAQVTANHKVSLHNRVSAFTMHATVGVLSLTSVCLEAFKASSAAIHKKHHAGL